MISALFFLGYGTFRFICEFFREPDAAFLGPVSMGMALSIPIWLAAGALFWAGSAAERIATLERTVLGDQAAIERVAVLEEEVRTMKDALARIESKLDRVQTPQQR